MSGRMHSKQSRAWDRGSPGRRRPSGERGNIDDLHKRDLGSPDRPKRGRWESPPKNRMDSPRRVLRRDFESPPHAHRKDVISPLKSRRTGYVDGLRPTLIEQHTSEEEYRYHAMHSDGLRGQEPAGLVFLCSSSTLRECFHFRVLGLPAAQREVVERVVPGTKLFLFNFDTKELFGVFEAASRGGLNLVPEAFRDLKGTYAAQVRFNIFRECLPLADDIVKDVLRENFSQRGKFDCELSADQVLKIMELFSRQEMRTRGPVHERDKHVLDSSIDSLDADGRSFSSAFQGSHVLEKAAFPESQHLMNKYQAEGAQPDPAVILGQGMIKEADQLALKYLQNDPGFTGIRLEPVNISLLSSSLRNNSQSSFSMDLNLVSSGGNLSKQSNGMLFPGDGGAIPNSRLLGHAASAVPDSANMDRIEHPGAESHFISAPLGSERGLLPVPGMHHHMLLQPGMPLPTQPGFPLQPSIPNQPGMMHPFPVGSTAAGAFPLAAGPLGGPRPDFGGPYVPVHHLQGPHSSQPPSQLMNPSQMVNRPIKKRKKQKKRTKRIGRDDTRDDAASEALDTGAA